MPLARSAQGDMEGLHRTVNRSDCAMLVLLGYSLSMVSMVLPHPLASAGSVACIAFAGYGAWYAGWRLKPWSTKDRR